MKKLILGAGLILLAACAQQEKVTPAYIVEGDITKVSDSKKFDSQRELFRISLAREYNIISERTALHKDYTSSTYFRRKARNSQSRYFDTLPEKPQNWRIKNELTLNRLYTSRADLVNKLQNKNLVIAAPVSAAKAQAYYDCWVEQEQSKGRDYDFNCRENFTRVNNYLEEVETEIRLIAEREKAKETFIATQNVQDKIDNVKYEPKAAYAGSYADEQKKIAEGKDKPKPKPAPKKAASDKPATATTTTTAAQNPANFIVNEASDASQPDIAYVIYFDGESDTLRADSQAELDKAVADIKTNSPSRVAVNGHTDSSIEESKSLTLSKTRADKVRDLLDGKGVSKGLIRTYGFGKSDVNSKLNNQNRVEITFKQKKQ